MQTQKSPVSQETRSRWWRQEWVLPAAIALLGGGAWLWFALGTHFAMEDSFITFRYARNLARGLGFVYNPGERVLGTTAPLQALLLAGLGAVLGPDRIPAIASVVMPPFGIAAGWVMYAALRRFGVTRAGAAAGMALYSLHPFVIRIGAGGMETTLVLFLMALSLYFLARERAVAATGVGALLVLCRVDGMIWAAGIAGAALLGRARRPLRQAAAFGAILLPWVLFAWQYFGSPLPNTMRAKGVTRPGGEDLLVNAGYLRSFAEWCVGGTGFGHDHPLLRAWLVLLALGVYVVARSPRRELWLLPAFAAVYPVVLYLGRAPMYPWYLLPMVLVCVFLGGLGIGQLITWVAAARAWPWRVAAGAAAAGVLLGGWGVASQLPREVAGWRSYMESEHSLRQGLGVWLKENTPANASVAMEAIGFQGYYSDRRVIDQRGLISPDVVKLMAGTGSNGLLFKRIWTELRPDYIVLRSFEAEENHHFNGGRLFETDSDRAAFFGTYREVRRFVGPHAGPRSQLWRLTLYARRPGA